MESIRTETENSVVSKDILELERKIRLFKEDKFDEERFKSLRLTRGIYGQRQPGVQMIRIKLPYGKVRGEQLHRIADVSDEYSGGRLHITTRQDIQIHHVSLDRTPELWAELEKSDITLREAGGNVVRNVTASETAGIDPDEPFDVSPYAHATFEFFLRNPVCQEMGRKFKISFSGTEHDTALSYIHDLGFVAKTKTVDGEKVRGFKVLLAGGLGALPRHADVAYEFLPADKVIPFIEGVIRVFDRYGERSNRLKARLKFLVKDLGLNGFLNLVTREVAAVSHQSFPIDENAFDQEITLPEVEIPEVIISNKEAYVLWKKTNVFAQKQEGLFAIGIHVPLGDFYTDKARLLADLVKQYAGDEIRLTLRQNILIRHVRENLIPFFFVELEKLGFTGPGYNSTVDITACPGTDTCNLGIASSTGIATELEKVLISEYPQYLLNKNIIIKISGCMNACGQHNIAHIGFQGMTIKTGKLVVPALQILLGGGASGDGEGMFSDKVVKIPAKRGPGALRLILNDYEANADGISFHDYYDARGKRYFYDLLKPLADTGNLTDEDYIDWGHDKPYIKAVGIGECAGIVIDLVSTLLFETEEKLESAKLALESEQYADGIYHAYSSMVNSAKALLISENIKTNSQAEIVRQFDEFFVNASKISIKPSFAELVYKIKSNKPTKAFAGEYIADAFAFYKSTDAFRTKELINNEK